MTTVAPAAEVSAATVERVSQALEAYEAVSPSWGAFARREAEQAWRGGSRTEAFWARRAERIEASVASAVEEAKWVEVEGSKTCWMDNSVEVTVRHSETGETKRVMLSPPSGDACF